MSEGKISFSLGGKAGSSKAAPAAGGGGLSNLELLMAKAKGKPPAPKPALLFDDDEDESQRPPPDLLKPKAARKQAETAPRVNLMSRAERRAQEEALKIDQSVFDYDGVYDDLKAAEREVEAARNAAKADKTPKYAEAFRAAAQTRKLDRLRAEEKMLEREREKEGDEFADKEKFVTEAYKRQMEEVRAAEQAEKEREDALRKSNKGPGLTSLYASMLDEDAAKNAAAMAATAKKDSGPSLAVRPPPAQAFDDQEEYDPLLAAEARRSSASGDTGGPGPARLPGSRTINADTGKEIEVNDDGEVVDKRSLLKAGLNITKKPKPELPPSLLAVRRSAAGETAEDKPYVSRAVGSSASYAERMARERKRLAEQIRAEEEKKRAAAEQRAAEEEEAARRRREGDDGTAAQRRSEAKERYLARKRARDEAEAARKRQKAE